MLDAIRTILDGATIATILVVIVSSLTRELRWRIALAALAGAWVGAAIVASTSRAFDDPVTGALTVLIFFSFPLVATAILAVVSPRVRAALLALPTPLLIGLNVIRVLGALMLLLAVAGRLSGPFPYSAGWGDVITGVFALPVAWMAANRPDSGRLVAAWNAFGMLDLIVAVGLGVTSRAGSPVQLIHAGVGSAAITQVPWVLTPTVLVPFFLITHGVIFAQLRLAHGFQQRGQPRHVVPVAGDAQ